MKRWIYSGVSLLLCAALAACAQETAASGQMETRQAPSKPAVTSEKEEPPESEAVAASEREEPESEAAASSDAAASAAELEPAASSAVPEKTPDAAAKEPQSTAQSEAARPTPQQTAAPAPESTPEPTPEPTPTAAAAQAPQGEPKEIAQSYIGRSTAGLTDQIGQPLSTEYASSCIGDGEDGIWYYEGFAVYTYRGTDGSERVEDVF